MLFDLSAKVAVITGASRGIGKSIALAMAEAGANVVISSRKLTACQAVADEINARFDERRALAVEANISSKNDLGLLVQAAIQAFGRLDCVVCNAASSPYFGPLARISDELFRKTLDNNVLSINWLVQFSTPELQRAGGGSIIIVSSVEGFRGSSTIGAYSISKAADMQLARNLAVELGPSNIRVNCIAPGLIRTDFAKALWEDPATRTRYEAMTAVGRLGEPHEIAGCAVFLAAPAGSYTTGQTFTIDGGMMVS